MHKRMHSLSKGEAFCIRHLFFIAGDAEARAYLRLATGSAISDAGIASKLWEKTDAFQIAVAEHAGYGGSSYNADGTSNAFDGGILLLGVNQPPRRG
ncbi:hypothetical protein EAS54_32150 [Bradyrhizobium guangzhouense]|nr:hypothetical protein EAS54_32150 [Bradyrhizobium guangzhouense]